MKITIRWLNDDYVDILLNNEPLTSVNYDEHGSDGMRAAIDLARAFAARLDAEVIVEGTPNL